MKLSWTLEIWRRNYREYTSTKLESFLDNISLIVNKTMASLFPHQGQQQKSWIRSKKVQNFKKKHFERLKKIFKFQKKKVSKGMELFFESFFHVT